MRDGGQRWRHLWSQLEQRRHALLQHCVHDLGLRLALEDHLTGERLVQASAEREDIGAPVERAAQPLLGRHVADLALDHAGLGVVRAPGRLGDAEVEQLHATVVAHHDVVRADVAVHEVQGPPLGVARRVRVVQRLGALRDHARQHHVVEVRLAHRAPQQLVERGAVHPLHGDEPGAVLLADLVDLAQVGMEQAHHDARLVEEHVRASRRCPGSRAGRA